MATIFSDTWTGSNGDAWNAQWTKTGTLTADIQSNAGRIATGTSAYGSTGFETASALSSVNYTAVFKLKIVNTTDGGWFVFCHFRGSSGLTNTPLALPSSYEFRLLWYNPNSSIGVNFYEIDSGGNKTYRNGADHLGGTISAGDWIWFKFEVGGNPTSTLRYRIWKDGSSEPGTWTNDWASSVVANNQGDRFALIVQNGNDTTSEDVAFDDLTIDDGSVPSGQPSVKRMSGVAFAARNRGVW